jgi:hypothetical protein
MTAKEIIRHYTVNYNSQNDTWLIDCRNAKDFMSAVEMAGMSRDRANDKHPHQFRVPNNVLRKFTDHLLRKAGHMLRCKNFEQLQSIVDSCRVKGIGTLTIYDATQRIGANIKLEPQKIYLHQGTRIGAQRYLQRTLNVDSVDRSEFKDFSKMSCAAIEDIMCIYKGEFPLRKTSTGFGAKTVKC